MYALIIKLVLFPNIAIKFSTGSPIFINRFLNHYILRRVSVKTSVLVFGVFKIIILAFLHFHIIKPPNRVYKYPYMDFGFSLTPAKSLLLNFNNFKFLKPPIEKLGGKLVLITLFP